ncbi:MULTISPECIES: hypothetical protein [Nostoc]|uniref:Uncharacterized protein n=1 Tax=Nostoc paludosum FACHB-159 TaxID=2692908 RepID=A0ABR8KN04_9NOSO|nr:MULTISPECIES: hypothetical protein [Nostoc]MBD2683580.1 hypothetical protein [Nostoc sp. FACHB-857]MBD2739899.1 hypothetical protein [Nostoc paludosum FACHB-159]
MELNPVYDPKTLNQSKVYMIEGTRYKYLRIDGSRKNIKYVFSPLPNQRKTKEISLNETRLSIRCLEVQGVTYEPPKEQTVVQMGLL